MPPVLQHVELHALLAVRRQGGETYSVPLVLALEQRTARPVPPAAVLLALSRLEQEGLGASPLRPAPGRALRGHQA